MSTLRKINALSFYLPNRGNAINKLKNAQYAQMVKEIFLLAVIEITGTVHPIQIVSLRHFVFKGAPYPWIEIQMRL